MDWHALTHAFCWCHGTGPAALAAWAAVGGGLGSLARRLLGRLAWPRRA